MAQETLVIPTPPQRSRPSKTTLFTLSLAICNLFLILYVSLVISNMSANMEQNISEAIIEEIALFQDNLNNPETHDETVSQLGDIIADGLNKASGNVSHAIVSGAFKSFIPFDAFYTADAILNYNYSASYKLYSETLTSIGNSLFQYPTFQEFALYLTKSAAVAEILSTVQPLGNPIIPPANTTTSVFSEWVKQVPVAFFTTLYADEIYRQAGSDCVTLFTRLYNTEFVGVVEYPYGFESFNYNSDVKPVFSNIISFCSAIANAAPVQKPNVP